MMSLMIAGATIASLTAIAMLTGWIGRRVDARKGLQWADNAPRKPARIIAR